MPLSMLGLVVSLLTTQLRLVRHKARGDQGIKDAWQAYPYICLRVGFYLTFMSVSVPEGDCSYSKSRMRGCDPGFAFLIMMCQQWLKAYYLLSQVFFRILADLPLVCQLLKYMCYVLKCPNVIIWREKEITGELLIKIKQNTMPSNKALPVLLT